MPLPVFGRGEKNMISVKKKKKKKNIATESTVDLKSTL